MPVAIHTTRCCFDSVMIWSNFPYCAIFPSCLVINSCCACHVLQGLFITVIKQGVQTPGIIAWVVRTFLIVLLCWLDHHGNICSSIQCYTTIKWPFWVAVLQTHMEFNPFLSLFLSFVNYKSFFKFKLIPNLAIVLECVALTNHMNWTYTRLLYVRSRGQLWVLQLSMSCYFINFIIIDNK